MRKFLTFIFIAVAAFNSSAEQDLKSINPDCKSDVLAFGETLTTEAKNHFSHVERDYISFGLALRKRILEEGAISSQKYLDNDLKIRITGFLNKKELNDDEIAFLKFVRDELATYPLLIDDTLSKELKDKFLNLM